MAESVNLSMSSSCPQVRGCTHGLHVVHEPRDWFVGRSVGGYNDGSDGNVGW